MQGQGLLDFRYEADSSSHGLTSLAGLPLYLDLIKACGLGGAIQRHVRAAGGQGCLDIQIVLAVIFLNLSGGDCVEDLRTETTINNTYDFGIGKRLHNLPKLREIGFAANRRLLAVERASHDCLIAEDTFQAVNRKVIAGNQRASGVRFADPRTHALLHALILFRQLVQGFRSSDLRRHLANLQGRHPDAISQNAVTYQLRRLRLHRLIERIPNSFRYQVTDFGFRVALFFTRTYNRLLRPGFRRRTRPPKHHR